MSHGDML